MKNNYTSLWLPSLLFILLCVPISETKAQFEQADCSFENNCILVSYESIQEESPTSTTLLVVLSAFINDKGSCSAIDGLVFTPAGGSTIFLTRQQLEDDSFVELTVNRAAFSEVPSVVIAPFRFFRLPFLGIRIPIPRPPIVNLRARLNSDDPCLPITPLPVELISFTGLPTQSGINLSWSTASEKNNSHFEVERSADGQAYEQIAKVDGNGNSSVVLNYTYTDANPLNGENYYRLRQVDFDGKFEYSKTIAVSTSLPVAMQVSLAPNPCRNGNCEVLIRGNKGTGQTLLELRDMSGKVVLTKYVQNGVVQLSPDEVQHYKGLYILTATSGKDVVHQRVILE